MKKLILALLLCLPVCLQAQMTTKVLRDSLFIPWEMVYGPDDHIWFTQKNGYICRLDPVSKKIDTLYNETNTVIQSEGGMLGMVLHPDFANTPYVYVAYNYMKSGNYTERIARYTYSATNKTLGNPQTILDNIDASSIHNGCRLLIVDGKLIITTGDASVQSTAQDINSINGKVLRINLDGTIPTDNPIAGSPVWSWGHRNGQGLVYANNKLYESEHGPSNDDEVNIIQKARNYGWPTVQGYCNTGTEIAFCADSNVVEPLIAWTPTLAVSDIDYYDHPMFPSLQKSLIMATLKDQKLYQLKLNANLDGIAGSTAISAVNFGRIRSICVSPNGDIFIATSNSNASGSTRTDKIVQLYDPAFVPGNVAGINSGSDLTLYPNPAETEITFVTKAFQNGAVQYSLSDNIGQIVATGELTASNNKINIQQLPKGLYHVKLLQAGNSLATRKIVKQ